MEGEWPDDKASLLDHNTPPTTTSKRERRRRVYRVLLTELLAAACVFILVLLAVRASGYDDAGKGKKHKHKHPKHPKHPKPPKHPGPEICESPECIIAAASILQRIAPPEKKIDPCGNFEEFVCGGWRDSHDMRPDQAIVAEASLMNERSQMLLRHVIEGAYPDTSSHSSFSPMSLDNDKNKVDRQNFNKIKDAYNACMDEKTIDKKEAGPLAEILEKLKSIFLEKAHEGVTDAWIYTNEIGVSPLLQLSVGPDDKHPDSMAVTVYNPFNIGLPKEYYKDQKVVKAYTDAIASYFLNLKLTNDGSMMAQKIVSFEAELATHAMDLQDMFDITKTYNPMSINATQELLPQLNLGAVFSRFSPKYTPDKLIVASSDYLKELSKLMNNTDVETLQGYFQLKVANAYSPYISSEINKPMRELRNTLQGKDASVMPERWRTCVSEIDSSYGWILGRFFIEKAFSEKAKALGDRIIMDIKDEFVHKLKNNDWVSDKVKKLAKDKVYQIVQKIGYPDKSPDIRSPDALQKYYADADVTNSTFFENELSVTKSGIKREWDSLSKPTDHDGWEMTPSTVNAYYNPPQNEIVFPAGIMQRPLFGADLPGYINYGAFGAISGHELSHAFDSTGRHYDVHGNYTDWWDNSTVKNFEEHAQCFVDQYSKFYVEGPDGKPLHVNGKLTLGENIADAGGVNAAYGAWKKREKEKPDQLLPGLHQIFTKEQLFFVSYGAFWCQKARKEAAINRIYTDPHSPPFARIGGTMANSKDFLKAFKCPTKEATCKMW